MLFLNKKKKPVLGIDISSTSVKLLELSKTKEAYKVESYAVEPLPPNAVAEKSILDPEAVGDFLTKAIRKSGSRTKEAALAVAGSSVITKKIVMPAGINDDEMEQRIQLEADQYIPYPLDEVNLDFSVLGPLPNNPESVEVLLAASRSENVETRVAVAELAGLEAKIIDIEAYAIENAYKMITDQIPDYGVDKVTAIVDVGATMTSLNIIYDGNLIYTREQSFGGKQLTEEIMRRYGLSYEDAGRVKKEGGLPENYEPEVLEPFKQTMVQQIGRFLQFFYSSSDYDKVDYIALAGGTSAIPGIAEMVEDGVGIMSGIADPFNRIESASRVSRQRLLADGPSFLIACGLALRGVE